MAPKSTSEPLPKNPFPGGALHDAYDQCLALEAKANLNPNHIQSIPGCPQPIVCARLLGYLLYLAPAGNPQGQLQREISAAKPHYSKLIQLAGFYLTNFVRAFRRSSGPTPAPSEHPSRPSFEDAREHALEMMKETRGDHRTARILAMYRDNNCCMVTGLEDYNQPDGEVIVETAHIIPESVNKNIEEHPTKRHQSAGVWSVLSMFTNESIIDDLAGDRINRSENILSMNSHSHHLFDELKLWLKPMEDAPPHTYRVCTVKDSLRRNPRLPESVTFSTTTEVSLPCREYLSLHALCCEVAWMSGAAEYIMDVERRMDNAKVLANNGSSVDLLMVALSAIVAF
ncbi:hypothetical protein HD554DRAFT_2126605 [Boletus coccyginus]|nr:hypothetical protein HD554DRAFT_2126605 [Boletus coccyginus]